MDKNIELKVGEIYQVYNPEDFLVTNGLLFKTDEEKARFIQHLGIIKGNEREIGECIINIGDIVKVEGHSVHSRSVVEIEKYSPGEKGYDSRNKILEEERFEE